MATALSTPLMVALARTAYHDPAGNPAALLALPGRAAIAGSLIDGFVAGVYRQDPPPPGRRGRGPQSHDPGRARRWLSCLAYQLYQAGSRDLWWWRLTPGLLSARPPLVRAAVLAGAALTPAILLACSTALVGGPAAAGWAAVAGLMIGIGGPGVLRRMWPAGYPPYVPLRYRSPRRRRAEQVAVRTGFGVVFGLISGLMAGDVLLGLVGGQGCGAVMAVMPAWASPARAPRSAPHQPVRAHRRTVLTAAAQHGLVGGAVFTAVAGTVPGSAGVLAAGGSAGLVYGLAAAYGAGLGPRHVSA